jgi:pseudaminic acid synthase
MSTPAYLPNTFSIQDREIGLDYPPYVIAELSANHNGNVDTALELIKQAKLAGADAIKLQTYTADTITLKSNAPDFCIQGGLWHGRTLYDLYEEAHTPWPWHQTLFDYAREIGITIFSSPFDNTAVDLLESLNAPAYKVASFELVDLPLIRYIASTGKPMIMSTGMANKSEIQEAVEAARDAGCSELALLHCVSAYPANASDYNLRTLVDMKGRFGTLVGLSDHTLDNTTAITSVALGASIIEKHFTLDRKGGGPDDSFSLEPADLKQLCVGARTAWESLGRVNYERSESERGNMKFRRSLYFVRDLAQGHVITKEDLRSVRPGYGLPPKMLDTVLGAITTRAVMANTAVREGDFRCP